MRHLSGGCLCGKVRYTADADPVFTAICHCKNCQKQAGASFSLNVGIPAASLSLTGPIKTFGDTGDSGKPVRRRFCPECGSPVVTEVEAMPGLTIVKAGTLDDTSWLKPDMEIYCERPSLDAAPRRRAEIRQGAGLRVTRSRSSRWLRPSVHRQDRGRRLCAARLPEEDTADGQTRLDIAATRLRQI